MYSQSWLAHAKYIRTEPITLVAKVVNVTSSEEVSILSGHETGSSEYFREEYKHTNQN